MAMRLNEYQIAAMRTAKMFPGIAENLNHAALGMITETGEFVTEVKRMAIYEKPLSQEMFVHMVEEIGDLMWYVALACHALNVDLDHVCQVNVDKLKARFPNAYSDAAAEARLDKGGLTARES